MTESHSEAVILAQEKIEQKPPSMYKILLLNDDFTPMEFVIEVHMEGVGVCGIYPSDIASTKVSQVIEFARKNQHPLRCIMEEN